MSFLKESMDDSDEMDWEAFENFPKQAHRPNFVKCPLNVQKNCDDTFLMLECICNVFTESEKMFLGAASFLVGCLERIWVF